MADKKTAAKKPTKTEPVLEFDEGDNYWYIVEGTKRTNVGRSQRYAALMLDKYK